MATTNQANPGTLIIQGTSPVQFQNQQPVSANPQAFPVRTLKILGAVQLGLGIFLGILSLIGLILDAIAMNKACNRSIYDIYHDYTYDSYLACWRREEYSRKLFAYDVTCLVLSGWYIMTGFLPLCMSRKRENSWRSLRIAFMVCSIIGAAALVPTMFSLGVVGAIERGDYESKYTVLSAFTAVLSFAEFVIAIIAASYCCCCTPWDTPNQGMRIVYAPQPGMFVNLPQTQIPMATYQPNVVTAVGQPGNPTFIQYPTTAQQYQVVTTNLPVAQGMQTVQATGPTSAPQQQQQQTLPVEPPAYKE